MEMVDSPISSWVTRKPVVCAADARATVQRAALAGLGAGFLFAFTTWRNSSWVGTLSAMGSACWFTAFALAPVGLVRSVGQVEIVFTLRFRRFYLKETMRPGDIAGLVLVVGGVLLIVMVS